MKLKAILKCLCLPCVVLEQTLNGPRRQFTPQTGIMYLYVFLCLTVVLNLTVALNEIDGSTAEFNSTLALNKTKVSTAKCIQKSFVIFSMFLAIFLMWYLYRFTYQTVDFSHSRRGLFRIFYEGGIFLFGFLSLGYSVANVIGCFTCGNTPDPLDSPRWLNAIVAATKAIFILVQIVFLHFFYEARIPEESPHIEVITAHLLGTNLALWFWTLCSEEAKEISNDCLGIGDSKKYFLPLFVEYLLIAASLLYQIWKDSLTRDPTMSLLQCYINHQRTLSDNTIGTLSEDETDGNSASYVTVNNIIARRHNPCSCLGIIVGGSFATLFLVFVVLAKITRKKSGYYIAYSVGVYILYLAQICACFICQVSLQSHQRNPEHLSLDHEDILLYFSLVGIVLWEGLLAYTILLRHVSKVVDFGEGILAIAQLLFQTVTLVKLRRHRGAHDQCSIWICECIWFLMVTNLTQWVQDSFFIEVAITTPGKRYKTLQNELGSVKYIFYPLSIFYRFHSAVCCVLARPLFKS